MIFATGPLWVAAVRIGTAGVLMVVLALCLEGKRALAPPSNLHDVLALVASGWLALIGGVAMLGTVVSFFCYYQGVKDIGPSCTSMLASVGGASSTGFAALWLGTPLTIMDFAGLAFIVSTVFLLSGDTEHP
ncbi:DMT family transporter [Curtanaerobium respiraculi]|uniref:DMT family transporter n=1 Tax=Curtanaerobium respiraculi TaxID=2949669 RepID=UPI0024B3AACB|nr:DMT family transporter [Curtanaerobium respiraculi]